VTSAAPVHSASLRALLGGAIDYAGLFPPTGLELAAALANYQAYRHSADAWALGRFVVPVARLGELEGLLRGGDVALTALMGAGIAVDVQLIEQFNRRSGEHGGRVESVEVKAASEAATRAMLAELPTDWIRYLEIPLDEAGDGILDALTAARAFAKIRTGGITAGAFPPPDQVVQFLQAAGRRKLPFKATAGLHHPLRGSYRLSYAAGAPRGVMYGFLNLLLAAAVAWVGGSAAELRAALLEDAAAAIRLDTESLQWREVRLSAAQLGELRQNFFHGFGSCSFREPLDELKARGWA
jgi:hypothetical protein